MNYFQPDRVNRLQKKMNPDRKTAILFFSRSLKDEFLAKGVGFRVKDFSNLYQLLFHRTKTTLEATKIPIKILFSNEQIGSSFGERLTNGISALFLDGFSNVIIVGNDAPELTPEDIIWVKNRLENGTNVLGRDSHGGAYLIGLSKESFYAEAISGINWHTTQVFHQLKYMLSAEELSKKVIDLNARADFEKILRSTTAYLSNAFRQIIKSILRVVTVQININLIIPEASWLKLLELRGPPILTLSKYLD